MKKLIFTKHILEYRSSRIIDKNIITIDDIKKYYTELFFGMYNNRFFEGNKVMIFQDGENVEKILCGPHKFVFRDIGNNELLLITYAFRREVDKIEYSLLRKIRKSGF